MTLGYEVIGEGSERVILLHDWSCCTTTYDHCRPYFDTAAFSYALVDLRGYGKSRDIAGMYSVSEASKDVLDVVEQLDWESFHVLGHSMTGMVAQRVALDAPEKVLSITAVCPVSAQGMPMEDDTWSFFLSTTHNDDAYQDLMRGVCQDSLSEGWLRAKLNMNRERSTEESRVGYLSMFSKTDFAAEAEQIEQPVLVMTGEIDTESLNAEAVRSSFLRQHPHAVLHDLANCGHYPMQECPPRFVAVIEAFFAQHSAR